MAIGNLQLGPDFAVDTKAPTGFAKGQADKIEQSAKESLAALQTKQVWLLPQTPLFYHLALLNMYFIGQDLFSPRPR